MACVRRQRARQGLFVGLPLDPSSPQLYFDVLCEARCLPVVLRVKVVVAKESCQLGAIYKKKENRKENGIVCFHNYISVYMNLL